MRDSPAAISGPFSVFLCPTHPEPLGTARQPPQGRAEPSSTHFFHRSCQGQRVSCFTCHGLQQAPCWQERCYPLVPCLTLWQSLCESTRLSPLLHHHQPPALSQAATHTQQTSEVTTGPCTQSHLDLVNAPHCPLPSDMLEQTPSALQGTILGLQKPYLSGSFHRQHDPNRIWTDTRSAAAGWLQVCILLI